MVTVTVNTLPSTTVTGTPSSAKTAITSLSRANSLSPNSILIQQRISSPPALPPLATSSNNTSTPISASSTGAVRSIRRIVSNRTSSTVSMTSSATASLTTPTSINNDNDNSSFQNMVVEDSSDLGTSSKNAKLKSFYVEHCLYLPAVRENIQTLGSIKIMQQ
jgi:hypothetical protein